MLLCLVTNEYDDATLSILVIHHCHFVHYVSYFFETLNLFSTPVVVASFFVSLPIPTCPYPIPHSTVVIYHSNYRWGLLPMMCHAMILPWRLIVDVWNYQFVMVKNVAVKRIVFGLVRMVDLQFLLWALMYHYYLYYLSLLCCPVDSAAAFSMCQPKEKMNI